MKLKRLIACLLTAALLAGLLVFPASAARLSAFGDITDPQVAEAAEVLRVLGIVDGTGGGAFNPGRTLTRAEFCKMVIEIMGKGEQEPAQRNRTIFLDVKSTHWARGYINLAASTTVGSAQEGQLATRLIMGAGDGKFYPERAITFGEAVTILMRVLGYGNSDVATGANWYDGYVAVARSSGLADGLSLGGTSTITRGQAAILFYNLLFTKPKDGSDIYLTGLGGKKESGGVLLSVDATAPDGTKGAVKTTTSTYKTDRVPLDPSLEGLQGDVYLDKDGKLLAFQPDEGLTRRPVSVSGSPKATYFNAVGGERVDVKPSTTVYQDGEAKTYEAIWQDLKPGTPVTLCYTADGRLSYLFYRRTAAAESAMVARAVPSGISNPFAALVSGQTDYQIYKNGVPATVADIRQYDVATYDAASRVLNISDLRLTGVYENVYPNTETPTEITVLGTKFTVLPGAVSDLQSFRIGDQLTLLLTRDGQVAGAVSTDAAKSTCVGVVEQIEGGRATVKPLSDTLGTLEGDCGLSGDSAARMVGQLVTVSSYKVGQITLAKLSGSGASASLNVAAGTLGATPLAENVRFYERVGGSAPREISREQLTCATVPASKILYVGKDYAGKISVLVFNDVTGDLYTYGRLTTGQEQTDSFNGEPIYNVTVTVETDGRTAPDGWQNQPLTVFGSVGVKQNEFGGIAPSLDTLSGKPKLAGYVTLTAITGVRRSAFDLDAMTVTTTDMVLPISQHVVCYNKTTGQWFPEASTPREALERARAYSDNLTIYYDKAPQDGGKVRVVVVS